VGCSPVPKARPGLMIIFVACGSCGWKRMNMVHDEVILSSGTQVDDPINVNNTVYKDIQNKQHDNADIQGVFSI
jgi:hypothetical protein